MYAATLFLADVYSAIALEMSCSEKMAISLRPDMRGLGNSDYKGEGKVLKKTFFKFVTSYSIIHHFFVFLGVFLLVSLMYTLLVFFCANSGQNASLVDVLAALITSDVDKLGYSKLWQSGYFAMSSVIVLVWQSVLILKFLNRPEYLLLSNVLTYYKLDYHNQSNEKEDFLVFRLVNDGYSDLYEVDIKVTYRLFDEETNTFQHYVCRVKNGKIPVLKPIMPFRIYIQTGVMNNIRNLYLDPANIHNDEAVRLNLQRVTINERPLDELIVFITGYDSQLDQTKSVSQNYKMDDIRYGKFVSINPVGGKFSDSEIFEKLDKVENSGEWAS